MKKLRWNWPVWLGFVFSIVAFVSYFLVFARFPATRNVPWANFLLFGAGAAFLWNGLRRVLGGAEPFRGKIVSSILTLLSVSIFCVFCFVVFHATRQLPASPGSPKIGEKAPEFAVAFSRGITVRASPVRPGLVSQRGTSVRGRTESACEVAGKLI
jgi:hypothetical protein